MLSQTWDSFRAMPGKAVPEVFVARLPDFAYDIGRGLGNNALFVYGEYNPPPGIDSAYLAVNLAPQESLQREILCHSNFRIDPVRAGGAPGTGALSYKYLQGYKLANWETKRTNYRGVGDFPIKHKMRFWWRIVVHPAGYLVYLEGQLVMFSAHPPRLKPQEWDALFVQLPLGGEKGEKATWKALEIWWGAVGVSPSDEEAVRKVLKDEGRPVPAWSKDEVRISNLPPGVSQEEVRAAFAHYSPVALLADSPTSYVLRVADPGAIPHILKEMEGAAAVRGTPCHVARVLLHSADSPPVTGAGPGSGGAGAGGALGAGAAGGYLPAGTATAAAGGYWPAGTGTGSVSAGGPAAASVAYSAGAGGAPAASVPYGSGYPQSTYFGSGAGGAGGAGGGGW